MSTGPQVLSTPGKDAQTQKGRLPSPPEMTVSRLFALPSKGECSWNMLKVKCLLSVHDYPPKTIMSNGSGHGTCALSCHSL